MLYLCAIFTFDVSHNICYENSDIRCDIEWYLCWFVCHKIFVIRLCKLWHQVWHRGDIWVDLSRSWSRQHLLVFFDFTLIRERHEWMNGYNSEAEPNSFSLLMIFGKKQERLHKGLGCTFTHLPQLLVFTSFCGNFPSLKKVRAGRHIMQNATCYIMLHNAKGNFTFLGIWNSL